MYALNKQRHYIVENKTQKITNFFSFNNQLKIKKDEFKNRPFIGSRKEEL